MKALDAELKLVKKINRAISSGHEQFNLKYGSIHSRTHSLARSLNLILTPTDTHTRTVCKVFEAKWRSKTHNGNFKW